MQIKEIQQTPFGVYVWQMPDGSLVGDGDGNWMSIAAREGDLKSIGKLKEAAKYYGVEQGKPMFLPGHRKVTDSEYLHQKTRMELGLIPDDYDAAAWKEEVNAQNAGY